jgi:hypothetical protein
LIVLILLLSVASLARPAYAQGFTIALNPTTINAGMNAVVSTTVTVTNTDGLAHTVNLSIGPGGTWWWPGTFSVNPVVLPALVGAQVASVLNVPVPGPGDICPGESAPGPYYMTFAVAGTDSVTGLSTSAPLIVNLLPITFPLTVHIEPSKSSYMVGETIVLKMDSNLPAEYYLKVRKPDGTVWASAHAYLPATFTKKATDPLGTYTAELTAYYCGVAQDTATFTVTPDTYDITISLSGLATDATTALYVDGNKVADMKGGDVRVLSYPIGSSHTFKVDQYVNGAAGYRYYCASDSWTANAAGSNVFNYVVQVYLDVSTDPTGVTDVTTSGWYAKGSSASVAAVPAEVEGAKGTRYVFSAWTVDGTPRSGNGFVVVMDAPHKAVAKYDTMFLLTIVSDYGNPKGSGYYKSGDTATFSVDSPVGMGIQQVFVEWTGDYSGKDPRGSLRMDGSKTVTAVWTTSYFQIYIIVGVVAVIAFVAGLLLLMQGRRRPRAIKPPPPPPSYPTETPETPAEPAASTTETETTSKPAVSIALRCTNCGHGLKEGQIFCPECGQKQTD